MNTQYRITAQGPEQKTKGYFQPLASKQAESSTSRVKRGSTDWMAKIALARARDNFILVVCDVMPNPSWIWLCQLQPEAMPFPKKAEADRAPLETGTSVRGPQGRAQSTLNTSTSAPTTITFWQSKLLTLKWANTQLKFFRSTLSFS